MKHLDDPVNFKIDPAQQHDPSIRFKPEQKYSLTKACEHVQCDLDIKERTVQCRICGAVVDPFDHLLTICRYGMRLENEIAHLERLKKDFDERDERKQKTCRHKNSDVNSKGFWQCRSCGLTGTRPIAPLTPKATP